MEHKEGYKTTEFWAVMVTSLIGLLNQSGILGSIQLPTEAIATIAGLVATYVIGRTFVKNKAVGLE